MARSSVVRNTGSTSRSRNASYSSRGWPRFGRNCHCPRYSVVLFRNFAISIVFNPFTTRLPKKGAAGTGTSVATSERAGTSGSVTLTERSRTRFSFGAASTTVSPRFSAMSWSIVRRPSNASRP